MGDVTVLDHYYAGVRQACIDAGFRADVGDIDRDYTDERKIYVDRRDSLKLEQGCLFRMAICWLFGLTFFAISLVAWLRKLRTMSRFSSSSWCFLVSEGF